MNGKGEINTHEQERRERKKERRKEESQGQTDIEKLYTMENRSLRNKYQLTFFTAPRTHRHTHTHTQLLCSSVGAIN
jgi:hypothetical protein